MTHPSWVALHTMAHSFIELDKAVVHVIRLVSFLWLWFWSFFGGSVVKASAWNVGDRGSIPGPGRSPGEGKWQPTSVLLPGESHGGRSLVGYSPWGRKESNRTEQLHFSLFHPLIKIRGLWKLPDGKDWLRGKLGLVLMGRAMLSKSLIQISVDGWSCVPSLLFTCGQLWQR